MDYYKAASLISLSIINLLLGIAVFLRNPKKAANVFCLLLTISLDVWAIGILLFLYSTTYYEARIWAIVFYIAPFISAQCYLFLGLTFPEEKVINKKLLLFSLLLILIIGFTLVMNSRILISSLEFKSWGIEAHLNTYPYLLYSLGLLYPITLSIILLMRKSKQLKGLHSRQAKQFAYGLLFTSAIGVWFNLILPWFGNYRLIWIGPNCMGIYFAFVAYGALKHYLFDLRMIILRGLAYIVLYSLGIILYCFSFGLLLANFHEANILHTIIFASLTFLACILLLPLFRKMLDIFIPKIILRQLPDTKRTLIKITESIIKTNDELACIESVAKILKQDLQALYVFIRIGKNTKVSLGRVNFSSLELKTIANALSKEKVQFLSGSIDINLQKLAREQRASIISSVRFGESSQGVIIVGERNSGIPYTSEELKIIEAAAEQLTIALINIEQLRKIKLFTYTLENDVRLATEELKQKNDQLQEINNRKGDFISMASHQLLPQLTSSLGMIELIKAGLAKNKMFEDVNSLDTMSKSITRMQNLVNDMLNVSKLETGDKLFIKKTKLNLILLVQEELEILNDLARRSNKMIKFVHPQLPVFIMGDKDKIREVVYNFIENAIRYSMLNGKIIVRIDEKAGLIIFTVNDSGIGIPETEKDKLFTKFFRASNAKQKNPAGTGIGLYVAKEIIAAHNYELIYESKENEGSKFGFAIPTAYSTKTS